MSYPERESAPTGQGGGAGGVTREAVPAADSSTAAAAGNHNVTTAPGPMLTLPAPLAALAEEPTFCLYKTAPSATKPGKLDKRPCNYRGEVADANDPRNHMSAELACQWAAHYGPPYGVAKVFPPGGRFFFIDIDNCLQDDGQWSPLAQTLMQRLAGCAVEVSASGRGLHIFGRGPVPEHGCRNTALGLELYTEGRFVALTGTGAVGDAGHTPPPDVWPWLVPTYFPPRAGGAGATVVLTGLTALALSGEARQTTLNCCAGRCGRNPARPRCLARRVSPICGKPAPTFWRPHIRRMPADRGRITPRRLMPPWRNIWPSGRGATAPGSNA